MRRRRLRVKALLQSNLVVWGLSFICIALIWNGLLNRLPVFGQSAPATPQLQELLPLQAHPLPPSLAKWQASDQSDYFDVIQPTELGYLVWSTLPVQIYIQPDQSDQPDQLARSAGQPAVGAWNDAWNIAVNQAVQEWNVYLPLTLTADPETADITILRRAPPLQRSTPDHLPRIRAAETRYDFFVRQQNGTATFFQRLTIQLSPSQTADYTLATIRHELGHALGIWGHSPLQTDALYFSQVRNPTSISARDINTLKRIYQQPTRLGWQISL
jgi:predicted Zn-dependent protease